jgi:ComF family protein
MGTLGVIGPMGRMMLDFVLPPRCPSCGTIVGDVDLFCADCWGEVGWMTGAGCDRCGHPLEASEESICGACLASPPRLDRVRAAVEYGEMARILALKLKYGRKTAIARTMARYMERHLPAASGNAVLAPVPLHRTRLWNRGFNQSALIARVLAARTGLALQPELLSRVRRTPRLKDMSVRQRERIVAGAFAVRGGNDLQGRTVILVDDVYTTGSTANACARALKKAGAARVELVAWARVVRPSLG